MKASFDIKSYSLESFCCALLLMFASFSVLPFSVAIVEEKEESAPTLVRVYSREDKQNSTKETQLKKSLQKEITLNAQAISPTVDAPSLDFSSLNIGLPNLTAGADFKITAFEMGANGIASTGIVAFELSGLDKIPRRLNNVKIKYPADMLRRGIEGEVRLNVIIDEQGNLEVESVASSTDKKFETSAIASASKFKYEIPLRDGKPVRAKFVLPIPFKILK